MPSNKTLLRLYKEKEDFIESSLATFDNELLMLQTELFDKIMADYLPRFETRGGVIIQSEKNFRISAELNAVLEEFKQTQSLDVFSKLGNNMIEMSGLTSKYYRSMVGSKAVKNITDKLKGYHNLVGINEKGKVIEGSFLDNLAANDQMKNVLSGYVQRSISSGTDLQSFINGFKDIIKGTDETVGAYEKYVGTYARDTFYGQARQQDNFFAENLGLEHFAYVGEIIRDSRPFCVERHGQVFTKEEGESWNNITWQGKIPGVDFFVQAGGYNCRHNIRWITDEMAEEGDINELNQLPE